MTPDQLKAIRVKAMRHEPVQEKDVIALCDALESAWLERDKLIEEETEGNDRPIEELLDALLRCDRPEDRAALGCRLPLRA
ncbi:MAG: hypothetical protein HYT87_12890 [Nitrospirae bacterium]|nr:hypothetical protein [Nitrospirota bacterium]